MCVWPNSSLQEDRPSRTLHLLSKLHHTVTISMTSEEKCLASHPFYSVSPFLGQE